MTRTTRHKGTQGETGTKGTAGEFRIVAGKFMDWRLKHPYVALLSDVIVLALTIAFLAKPQWFRVFGVCSYYETKWKGQCVAHCTGGRVINEDTGACQLVCDDNKKLRDGIECVAKCPAPHKEPNKNKTVCLAVCGDGYHRNENTDECVPDDFEYALYIVVAILTIVPMIGIAWMYSRRDATGYRGNMAITVGGTWLPMILFGLIVLFTGQKKFDTAAILAVLFLFIVVIRIVFHYIDTIMSILYSIPFYGPELVRSVMGDEYFESNKKYLVKGPFALAEQKGKNEFYMITRPKMEGYLTTTEEAQVSGYTDMNVHVWKQHLYAKLDKDKTLSIEDMFILREYYYIPLDDFTAVLREKYPKGVKRGKLPSREVQGILVDSIVKALGKAGPGWKGPLKQVVGQDIHRGGELRHKVLSYLPGSNPENLQVHNITHDLD
jgi:hypothetical protein